MLALQMRNVGIIFMLVGVIGFVIFVLVGIEVDRSGTRVINFGGSIGSATIFVSGAVFLTGGLLGEIVSSFKRDLATMIGYPNLRLPPIEEVRIEDKRSTDGEKSTVFWFQGVKYLSREKAESARDEFIKKHEQNPLYRGMSDLRTE